MPSAVARKFIPLLKLRRASPAPAAPAAPARSPTRDLAPDAAAPAPGPARAPRQSTTAPRDSNSPSPADRSPPSSAPRRRADHTHREQLEQLTLFRHAALHPSMLDNGQDLASLWTMHSVNVLNYHDPPRHPVDTSATPGEWSEWGGFARRHVPRRPSAPPASAPPVPPPAAAAAAPPAPPVTPARLASAPNLRASIDSIQEGPRSITPRPSFSFGRSRPSLAFSSGEAGSSRVSLLSGPSPSSSTATSVDLGTPPLVGPRKSDPGLWARFGLAPRRSSAPDAPHGPSASASASAGASPAAPVDVCSTSARSASLPTSALMPPVVEYGELPPPYEEVEQLV